MIADSSFLIALFLDEDKLHTTALSDLGTLKNKAVMIPDDRQAIGEQLAEKGYRLRVQRPTSGMEVPTLLVEGTSYRGEQRIAGYFGEGNRR